MKEASIRQLVAWGLAVILAWAFIYVGWKTIFPSTELEMQFVQWGYNLDFACWIGIAQLVVGVLVLVPRLASIAALGIVVLMIGAIYTNLSTALGSPVFAVILLLIGGALLVLRWPECILNPRRNQKEAQDS
jgi:putative oxidoreductase